MSKRIYAVRRVGTDVWYHAPPRPAGGWPIVSSCSWGAQFFGARSAAQSAATLVASNTKMEWEVVPFVEEG